MYTLRQAFHFFAEQKEVLCLEGNLPLPSGGRGRGTWPNTDPGQLLWLQANLLTLLLAEYTCIAFGSFDVNQSIVPQNFVLC